MSSNCSFFFYSHTGGSKEISNTGSKTSDNTVEEVDDRSNGETGNEICDLVNKLFNGILSDFN